MPNLEHPSAIPELPLPPPELTDAVSILRTACAECAPNSGVTHLNATELRACDALTAPNQAFLEGAIIGFGGALIAGFFFILFARSVAFSISIYRDSKASAALRGLR